ncbi:MAG: helix-turn-helix transcriptional regulator [Planctomycetales bacterium]|nr:helix-turn-helix transcriptional regulator [Planctomycetales bacterium]
MPHISNTEALILAMMEDGTEWYGLQLCKESNGRIKRGTVYTTLMRMEDKRLLTHRKLPIKSGQRGPARIVYKINSAGYQSLEAWRVARAAAMGGLKDA